MSLSQRHAQTVGGISAFRAFFIVFSRLMRSVTQNSACGPPWDAGWPTGAGPSTEADTKSDANLPSNAIVSFELVMKVDRWLWVLGMVANNYDERPALLGSVPVLAVRPWHRLDEHGLSF